MANKNIYSDTIGFFVLLVTVDGSKLYYYVAGFTLNKSLGNIANCQVYIDDYNIDIDKLNTQAPDASYITDLYKYASLTKNKMCPCVLYLYSSHFTDKKLWFRGVVCIVNPTISTLGGISSGMTCLCLGKASLLLYTLHADFIYAPSNMAKDWKQLLTYGLNTGDKFLSTLWGSDKLSLQTVIANAKQKPSDNIALLLGKVFAYTQNWQKIKGVDKNSKVQVNLSDYIKTKCKLSSYIQKLGSLQNPYIVSLDLVFLNLSSGNSIWLSIVSSIGGDKLLTVRPPAMGLLDKMLIVPNYVTRVAGTSILLDNLISTNVTAEPLAHIRTPDVLYVGMSKMIVYSTFTTYQGNKIYGRYPGHGSNLPKNPRVKFITGPSWLLSIALDNASKKINLDTKVSLKNTSAKKYDANNYKDIGLVMSQGALQGNLYTQLLDSYAKTVYFNNYMMDRQARLTLTPTRDNIALDKHLGLSITLKCPIDLSLIGLGKPSLFYGVLSGILYSYTAAKSPKDSSSFHINCIVKGITQTDGLFADIYKQSLSDLIYQR